MSNRYRATVIDSYITEVGEKKTPVLKMGFQTLFNLDTPNVVTNKYAVKNFWLSEGAIMYTVEALRAAFNWAGDDLTFFHGAELIGDIKVDISIVEKELVNRKGETYKIEEVEYVNPVGGGRTAANDRVGDDVVKSIASKLRGPIMACQQDIEQELRAQLAQAGQAAKTTPPTKPTAPATRTAPTAKPATATSKANLPPGIRPLREVNKAMNTKPPTPPAAPVEDEELAWLN